MEIGLEPCVPLWRDSLMSVIKEGCLQLFLWKVERKLKQQHVESRQPHEYVISAYVLYDC